jgi:hypothetical protein
LGQKKFAEAAELLVDGYTGINARQDKIPEQVRQTRIIEALERIVALYQEMDQPEPLSKWRAELEAVRKNSQDNKK